MELQQVTATSTNDHHPNDDVPSSMFGAVKSFHGDPSQQQLTFDIGEVLSVHPTGQIHGNRMWFGRITRTGENGWFPSDCINASNSSSVPPVIDVDDDLVEEDLFSGEIMGGRTPTSNTVEVTTAPQDITNRRPVLNSLRARTESFRTSMRQLGDGASRAAVYAGTSICSATALLGSSLAGGNTTVVPQGQPPAAQPLPRESQSTTREKIAQKASFFDKKTNLTGMVAGLATFDAAHAIFRGEGRRATRDVAIAAGAIATQEGLRQTRVKQQEREEEEARRQKQLEREQRWSRFRGVFGAQ